MQLLSAIVDRHGVSYVLVTMQMTSTMLEMWQ